LGAVATRETRLRDKRFFRIKDNNRMSCLYMAFEMLHVFENKPLRLAHWVITLDLGEWVSSFEVNPLNVIHHLRRAAKRAHPLLIALRFVANADRALVLGKL
jgi:hypothetical protein